MVISFSKRDPSELVSTRLLSGQSRANPGGAIVAEILQMQRGAPVWRFMTVRRSGSKRLSMVGSPKNCRYP
ncbi:hypothetical protein LINPERHAP1_LOCUS35440 [Linum perenne]